MEIDIMKLAEKTNLDDNQKRFIKKQSNRVRTFELWPRRTGKTEVAKLILLHALLEEKETIAFVSHKPSYSWQVVAEVVDTFKQLNPDAKVERKKRDEFVINDTTTFFGWTYDTLGRGKLRGWPSLDHIHMEEYKMAPKDFRGEWESTIKHKGKRITGLSSRL
jgi:hypothetical protein